MHPMMNMMAKLKSSAAMGTCCLESIFPSQRLPKIASSRANDQVKREAVWWVALRAKKTAKRSRTVKTVAATSERDACRQISKIGTLPRVSVGMLPYVDYDNTHPVAVVTTACRSLVQYIITIEKMKEVMKPMMMVLIRARGTTTAAFLHSSARCTAPSMPAYI